MQFATATTALSYRERAIQAAVTAKLTSFAAAYESNPAHAAKVASSLSKTSSALARFATLCDTNVVKQLAFVQPNFRMATLSCPFPAIGREGEEVFAGSLGDSMNLPCPVTIRMQDVRGDVISVSESKALVTKFNLPTSANDPLEEEGPPLPEGEDGTPPGPDRIKITIDTEGQEPCFVAIPKVLPITSGVAMTFDDPTQMITQVKELPPTLFPSDSLPAVWYKSLRYGTKNMGNHSLQSADTMFCYERLEKTEFTSENRNLSARFTTIVTFLNPDDPLYHEVAQHVLAEKEKATVAYGTKLLELAPAEVPPALPGAGLAGGPQAPLAAGSEYNRLLFEGLKDCINSTKATTILTGVEREKQSEAEDAERFYSILFASVRDAIDEDGKPTKIFVKAKLQPQFLEVLKAQKNSKATQFMQEAIESIAAELAMSNDKYAADSNIFPRMFDQPMVAALRTAKWEYGHTVMNPTGVTSNIGLHHLAPVRTWGAIYKSRQEGETKLIQQEQVGEDKSRIGAKTTELYHYGCMGSLSDLNETLGNFFALMCTIAEIDPEHPPLLWTEITQFAMLFRAKDGKQWAATHRNMREVMFNVIQDIQSTIAGFVSEAHKTSYKTAMKTGATISPQIFDMAIKQATHIRANLLNQILLQVAGPYKEVHAIYNMFQPPDMKKDNTKKRDASSDGTPSTPESRNRPFQQTSSNRSNSNTVTPSGSPGSSASTSSGPPLPAKTVLVHEHPIPNRLPHPGSIFPHPTRPNTYTIMCGRGAYAERSCPMPGCNYFHFPSQLTQVPRELKEKLKTWVSSQPKVTWHPDVANWVSSAGR